MGTEARRESSASARGAWFRASEIPPEKPVDSEEPPEAVAILMASACFAAEGGSGVAERSALRRRVAHGDGLAASPSHRTATLHALDLQPWLEAFSRSL
ncbi:hypothetical protein [Sorangium sp. So ce1335]|uniref:hypothetical protein n=1 Tax=Sorangium sp. So ce1335 TaxID=3133335 RepID=UPI003F61A414